MSESQPTHQAPKPRLEVKLLDERLRDYMPQYATLGSAGMDLRDRKSVV